MESPKRETSISQATQAIGLTISSQSTASKSVIGHKVQSRQSKNPSTLASENGRIRQHHSPTTSKVTHNMLTARPKTSKNASTTQ